MATVAAPPSGRPTTDRTQSVGSTLAVEWHEVGGLGRIAIAGLLASAILAVALGLWIPNSVQRHLFAVRTDMLQGVVDEMAAEGLLPLGAETASDATIDAAIERRIIGGEVVAVTVRDADGAIVLGDAGTASSRAATRDVAEQHTEQHDDGLLHVVLPVTDADGIVLGSFEVLQEMTSMDELLRRVERNVWLSISTGLATLAIAMGALTLAYTRVLDRRRRHAEDLFRELLQVEERERHRIVGMLHDDVGQPLYRVLYGLEGCRARLDGHDEVEAELGGLIALVHQADSALRAELHSEYRPGLDELDLASALRALAHDCREESGLLVGLDLDIPRQPSPVIRSVLVRAVQEALLNVRRHADARSLQIVAVGDDRELTIQIIDDGLGPGSWPRLGLGLTTANERLESLGGGLSLSRGAAGGTVLRMWAPLDPEMTP